MLLYVIIPQNVCWYRQKLLIKMNLEFLTVDISDVSSGSYDDFSDEYYSPNLSYSSVISENEDVCDFEETTNLPCSSIRFSDSQFKGKIAKYSSIDAQKPLVFLKLF